MNNQDNSEAINLAKTHDQEERAAEVTTLEGASVLLSAILKAHANGEPVIAEMAARIAERENQL